MDAFRRTPSACPHLTLFSSNFSLLVNYFPMKQRGQKSLKAVSVEAPISAINRPEPLPDLTPEQRLEWIYIVNEMRADWFPPETHALLGQYCKHVVTAKHLAQLIQECEAEKELDVVLYDKLLKMQERESRILASLATRMRLSQQSSYDREKGKAAKTKAKSPWAE
jgi:hypothetical protein